MWFSFQIYICLYLKMCLIAEKLNEMRITITIFQIFFIIGKTDLISK